MTVYEMIQELTRHDANSEVEINVTADNYKAYATVDEDLSEGDGTDAIFHVDETVDDFDIDEYKTYRENRVRINVELR